MANYIVQVPTRGTQFIIVENVKSKAEAMRQIENAESGIIDGEDITYCYHEIDWHGKPRCAYEDKAANCE